MAAGTGSTTSSLTSTSHTLTAAPAAGTVLQQKDMSTMLALLDSLKEANRHAFLQPSPALPTASLQIAKQTLDAFAGHVGDEQLQRLRQNRKRKRPAEKGAGGDVLKIRKVHVEGFETGQVWEQAKRVICGALQHSKDALRELEDRNEVQANGIGAPAGLVEFGEDGFEVGSDEDGEESASDSNKASEEDLDGSISSEFSDEDLSEGLEELDEAGDDYDEVDEEDEEKEEHQLDQQVNTFEEDPNGLNDGFFSIDEFNKESQWFEDQDARADPNTDVVSEDEELNWHADPLATSSKTNGRASTKGGEDMDGLASDLEDDDESDDEEGGATFGNVDLHAPEGDSEHGSDDGMKDDLEGGIDLTANDIYYKDFFAPPPKKVKKGSQPKKVQFAPKEAPTEADMERAMGNVRRDLFDDLSERSDSEDALSDVDPGDPKSRRSASERRQAKLAEEIRKLEAESVAKREWALTGEAAAADRPTNAILEEDLDFEHAGKPTPVITEEVSESIEEMIKRRILAQEFDEVLRRRPDAFGVPDGTRRGLVELDDGKPKQGLAELYEEEQVKDASGAAYASKADEKLRRDEREVEQLWRDVCGRLDALSSWHYKPKPAAAALSVVADVATVAMEDAQPTTAQGVAGGESMVAPQEVYRAGRDSGPAAAGELVAKSGLPVARQEMSREDKVRRRRRQKERTRKAGAEAGGGKKAPLGKRAQENKDTLADLKKGGVKVINRKGEIVDVDGNKAKVGAQLSSGNFKL